MKRPAKKGKLAKLARAKTIMRSLKKQPRYVMADIDKARQIMADFPETIGLASERLRDAIKIQTWVEQEMGRLQIVLPPWLKDLITVTNPKTKTKALRAAAARLRERCKDLTIPDLASVFGPKERGRNVNRETVKRITLAGDLSYEGLNERQMAPYISQNQEFDKRYEDTRKFWNRYRKQIQARLSFRKLDS